MDLWQGMFALPLNPTTGPQQFITQGGKVGKRIDFPEQQQILQLRTNGFTFSQLAPYRTWEDMRDAALPLWSKFVGEVQPDFVTRIALRYINSFVLPLPIPNFQQYLTYAPVLPEELGQGLAGFLTRVVVPTGSDDVGIITQSLEGEVPLGNAIGVQVLLDIDIAHPCKVSPADLTNIAEILDRLRDFKNKAFFSFLTDETLERFE